MKIEKIVESTEVITIEQARDHLRIDASGSPASHPDDTYITTLISVAREIAENYQERSIGIATYRMTMTGWQDIDLSFPEIIAVNSVKYDDADNVEQTLSSVTGYWVSDNRVLFREYPNLYNAPDNVRIEYQAGYDTTSSPAVEVPKSTYQAMLLLIGHMYENRESTMNVQSYEISLGMKFMLDQHRLNMGL